MKMFTVVVQVSGFNRERDENIVRSLERKDRRHFGGSGFSIFDGTRDLFFDTCKEEIANRLQRNLRAALKKNKIRGKVIIESFED